MTLLKKETLVFFVSCFTYLGLEVKHKVKELGYMYKDVIDLVVLVGDVDNVEKTSKAFNCPHMWTMSQSCVCICGKFRRTYQQVLWKTIA